MELVPIITQMLAIVATVFILVLLVSYIASKLKKKEQVESAGNNYNNPATRNYAGNRIKVDKSQYYGGSYYNNNTFDYPKEIKVVKRSGVSRSYSSNMYKPVPTNSNSRFTVLNSISAKETRQIETDDYGFKVYSDNEITRSVYLPG